MGSQEKPDLAEVLLQQIPHPLQRTLLHITGVRVKRVGNGARVGAIGLELRVIKMVSAQKDFSVAGKQLICDGSAPPSDTVDKGALGGGICTFLAGLQGQRARAARPADSLLVTTRH